MSNFDLKIQQYPADDGFIGNFKILTLIDKTTIQSEKVLSIKSKEEFHTILGEVVQYNNEHKEDNLSQKIIRVI
jgi:hypothetical protein